ncbi:MAG: sulfatase, partial [Bacteroidales bacterium]
NIDKLISEGTIYNNAYAGAANSAPSRACLMTGRFTPYHGIYTVNPPDRGDRTKRKFVAQKNKTDIQAENYTIPRLFSENGYHCAHIGKWHLGDDIDGSGPLSHGFSTNIAGGRAGTPYSYFYPYKNKKNSHKGLENGFEGEYLTDRLTNEAIREIKNSDENTPFFIYLAHHAVHMPLKAPEHLIKKYFNKKKGTLHNNPVYAAMVENLDTNVGKIMATVDSMGIADNTMIVFLSDNGGVEGVTDNYPLKGGKGMPYEGGIRVPLIIKYPPVLKAGECISAPVTNVDFLPSFRNILNEKKEIMLDGEDIFKISTENKRNKGILWHFPAYLEAYNGDKGEFRAKPYSILRSGNWKLIYHYETEQYEMFDLDSDIKESTNLADTNKKVFNKLKRELNDLLESSKAKTSFVINPY